MEEMRPLRRFLKQVPPDIEYKALYEEEKALRQETKALYGDAITRLGQANETIALPRHENNLIKKLLFGSKQERFVPSSWPEALKGPSRAGRCTGGPAGCWHGTSLLYPDCLDKAGCEPSSGSVRYPAQGACGKPITSL